MAASAHRNWAFWTVAAVLLLLAGCGGHHPADTRGAIVTALARSPQTYLYYRAPVWWGRSAPPRVVLVRTAGDWAAAKLVAPGARRFWRPQWALLHRVDGTWKVVAVRKETGHFFCRTVPRRLLAPLGLGCDTFDAFEGGLVGGKTAYRAPTGAEEQALRGLYVRTILEGHPPCGHLVIHVSRVDARYASIEHDPPMRRVANCSVDGNGVALYRRGSAGWRYANSASAGFGCRNAPPGVIRSLFAECWTG